MKPPRRTLIALSACALTLTTCMLPRGSMMRDWHIHEKHHATHVAAHGPSCPEEPLPSNDATMAPRPDPDDATFTFRGDVTGMREHLFLEDDGSYSYAERWDVGIPLDWELFEVGWDWKVGCRLHQCELPDGVVCCWQECTDGGDEGMSYEAPDRFGCMNHAADGPYQWFMDGLAAGGVPGAEKCL